MMFKIFFGFFLALLSMSSFADRQNWVIEHALQTHMVPFQFEYWVNLEDKDEHFAYLTIKTADGETIQTIPQLNVHLKPSEIQFRDFNFDGRDELEISTPSLITKADKQYFFYDDHLGKFVEDRQLSKLGQFQIDEQKKLIISSVEDASQALTTVNYHEFQGKQLVLTFQEVTACQAGVCEKSITHQNAPDVVNQSDQLAQEDNTLDDYLTHLITRKGVCLDKVKVFTVQNDALSGLSEANQCLNSMVYELLPQLTSLQVAQPSALSIRNLLDSHFQLMAELTVCEINEKNCEQHKEKAAYRANIKLANSIVEQLVVSIGTQERKFDQKRWLAAWQEMNEIMQG